MPFTATFRRRGDGAILERLFPCRDQVPTVLTAKNDPDRVLGAGDAADVAPFVARTSIRAKYPVVSTSIAVDPDRLPEARKLLGCDFTPSGRAIITSRAHRLRVLKAWGGREMS